MLQPTPISTKEQCLLNVVYMKRRAGKEIQYHINNKLTISMKYCQKTLPAKDPTVVMKLMISHSCVVSDEYHL